MELNVKNEFHNTSTKLVITTLETPIVLSKRRIKDMYNRVCPSPGCRCSTKITDNTGKQYYLFPDRLHQVYMLITD